MARELSAHGPDDQRAPQRPDLLCDMVLLPEADLIFLSTDQESAAPTTKKTHTDSG